MNNLILDIDSVKARAEDLRCDVISILDNFILCHRIKDHTFITWRVGINDGCANFIDGHYDMTQGAANKNLIERAFGEQPVVNTYQVWNSDHIATLTGQGVNNHAELVALEESTGYGYSSFVTTDDIDSIVNAVQNEFNGDLQYHLMESA